MHKLKKETARIFNEINEEMDKAQKKWGGDSFDDKNTQNDWIAYITRYAGNALQLDSNSPVFRESMIKVAGLAIRAVEQFDKGKIADRHYDEPRNIDGQNVTVLEDTVTEVYNPSSHFDDDRCF